MSETVSSEQPGLSTRERVKACATTLKTEIFSISRGVMAGSQAFGAEQLAVLNNAPMWAKVLAGVGGGLAGGSFMIKDLVQSWRTGIPHLPPHLRSSAPEEPYDDENYERYESSAGSDHRGQRLSKAKAASLLNDAIDQ